MNPMETIVQKFNLDGVTFSQNRVDRMHWSVRREDKHQWGWKIKQAIGYIENAAEEPRRVEIVRVGKRTIDQCNIPSGCKGLIDCLTELGHLYDDSPQWASFSFAQRKCGEGESPHMEISIYRVTEPKASEESPR